MRLRLPLAVAALAAVTFAGSAAAADGATYAKLVESKAPTIAMVKSVIKVSWEGAGRESESNNERVGVVVDPAGLVMVQAYGGRSSSMKMSATKLRVLFDGEEKEYDAVLGATDSKLGLAFVRVKDLAGKKLTAVNFAEGADPKIGDELGGVLRTDQGFDYAPFFLVTRIVGQVSKPRNMWLLAPGSNPVAHPLYHADGKPAGVVVIQQGISEEGSSNRTCLLPLKAVTGVVTQAIKASEKALEDAKAHDAEAAAAMSESGTGEDSGAMSETPPAMDDAPMDGGR
jgi:hypothetical protein